MPILSIALAALGGACRSTGSTPYPFPMPSPHGPTAPGKAAPTPPGATDVDGHALVGTALDLRGVPYKNGGANPAGFDCSGFTQYVFAQHGVSLPRDVREQDRKSTRLNSSHIQKSRMPSSA